MYGLVFISLFAFRGLGAHYKELEKENEKLYNENINLKEENLKFKYKLERLEGVNSELIEETRQQCIKIKDLEKENKIYQEKLMNSLMIFTI